MALPGGISRYSWFELREDEVGWSERLIWLLLISYEGLIVVESTL